MSKQQSSKFDYQTMTTAPVNQLILAMSVPSMIAMMITSIYNLADTFFVGRLGTSATAAVGVVFSVNMVLMALGFWVGTGASTMTSNLMGAKDNEKAQQMVSTAFFVSFGLGILVYLVALLGGDSLLRLLGATDTILPYAREYLYFVLLGGPFSASSLGLGQCMRSEGMSRESMYGQVAGGVLNMLLDPLFIFGLGWGIRGAAIATAVSQLISWLIMVQYYLRGKTQLRISLRYLLRDFAGYRQMLSAGFPSLARHCTNMVANVTLNTVAGNWGDAPIAAMSICSRLMFLSNAVSGGISNGCQPVIGFAYGNKDYQRVKDSYRFSVKISVTSMVCFGTIGFLFAPFLISLFRDDPEVISYGKDALRLICLALPFAAVGNCSNILFQIIKKPLISSGLIFGRQIILYVPLLLILPGFFQALGMEAAGPVADVCIACIALPLVLHFFRTELK